MIKLNLQSDLKEEILKSNCENKSNGFVLSVVGDLSVAAFKCPERDKVTFLDGPLEIITINGTLSPSAVHYLGSSCPYLKMLVPFVVQSVDY